jgi:hypothetical protein
VCRLNEQLMVLHCISFCVRHAPLCDTKHSETVTG